MFLVLLESLGSGASLCKILCAQVRWASEIFALAGPRVALERLATGGSALRYQADTNGGYLSLAVVTR